MEKKFNRKRKRNRFGYIVTILTIAMLFLILPFIIKNRAKKILKKEFATETNQPPNATFYIALNYLQIVAYFPGYSKKAADMYNDATLRVFGRYQISCMSLKDSLTDDMIKNNRQERDSVLKITKSSEQIEIDNKYDSIEDAIHNYKWLENLSEKEKKMFCDKWNFFFENTEFQDRETCEICKK